MSSQAAERLVAGRWTLETALRRGPSGVIWRATEVAGGRHLAVEQLRLPAPPDPGDPGGTGQSALWDRVAVETRAAASLDHPGLVGLEDVVVEDGVVFVATELVDAALTLDELVARHGPLPVRRVAQLGLELLDALEAAHAAGLVHLDLRPGNVLVTADGRARLAGVGLATLLRDLGAGSPGADRSYLAPEQLRGDPVGPPADLWSLGTILWLAVEGEPPFAGEGTDATATAILDAPPPPASLAGPLAPALHALLTKPRHPAAVPPSPTPAASWSRRPAPHTGRGRPGTPWTRWCSGCC
jgi:eukaryotic-like serine/threonine-protein kinase